MFEQESFDKASALTTEKLRPADPPKQIFQNYEMKGWFSTPILYKVLAVSAIVNVAIIAVMAQTNVLTARGCDSPWVGRVCQVVDMAYVGAVLFGTEREYADVAYEKTELADADITFIDVTGEAPPLDYPEGYFQIANPVQYAMLQEQAANGGAASIPGFENMQPNAMPPGGFQPSYTPSYTPPRVRSNDRDLIKQRANPPAPKPGALEDDLAPAGENGENKAGINQKGRGGKPSDSTANAGEKPGDSQVAENNNTPKITAEQPKPDQDEAQLDKWGVYINKRPLKDKATDTVSKVEAKNVQLDKPFKVTIEATLGLGRDGKTTVLKNPRPVPVDPRTPNDPAMVKLAQEWILAVGDAGWFAYLDRLDDKTKVKSGKVLITVEQTDSQFNANIRSEKASENAARSIASGLGLLLQAAAAATGGDERAFLTAAAPPTAEGNTLVLNFTFPKPMVQEMIQRKLAEMKEPQKQSNSTAVITGSRKVAG